MLAASHCTNHYVKPKINEHRWIDDHRIRIPWLNFLTSQSIPEETDISECSRYCRSDSESSSSSAEDCYIVLEVQKPRSIDETVRIVDEDLHFAQINEDDDQVNYEQLAQSMTVKIPMVEHAVEHRSQQVTTIDEGEKIIQRTNYILFHTPEKLDKSISVSDDDFIDMNERPTNSKIQISSSSEQESMSIPRSEVSGDFVDNDSLMQISRSDSLQTEQETTRTTSTRTLPFDDTHMEKYHRVEGVNMGPNTDCLISNNLSKTSTFLRLIKDQVQTIKNKCHFSTQEMKSNEPSLLQIKYLDGRPNLIDLHAYESQTLSNTVSSRWSLSTRASYRKRLVNHFQTLFKSESSRSREPTTLFGRFHEKKKVCS